MKKGICKWSLVSGLLSVPRVMFWLLSFLVVTYNFLLSRGLPVTSNGNLFNSHLTAILPGIIENVWDAPDFPTSSKDGRFLKPIPHPFFDFGPGFPMQDDALTQRMNGFSMRLMNSSWSGLSETNVFHKGELLHLQLSAVPDPGQKLYVLSCHASSSDKGANAEVSLVNNKGCVASKDSLVEFVLLQSDRVNLIVHTTGLMSSEVFLYCKVQLSDSGLTSVTKFCNYDKHMAKWVEPDAESSICQCCSEVCRSSRKSTEPHESLDLTAEVSIGPLYIKDEPSRPKATSGLVSDDTFESGILPEKMSLTGGSSNENLGRVSTWPVQPVFGGGVMVISKAQGRDLSMWLPSIFGLKPNPMLQLAGPLEHPAVHLELQVEEPLRKLDPDEDAFEKDEVVGVDYLKEGTVDFALLDDMDMWYHDEPFTSEPSPQEQPHLTFESVFNVPLNDQPAASPTPEDASKTKDEVVDGDGEISFRHAEMMFKNSKGTELSEPVLFSKLSVNQAADGSSSLNYEEEKRPGTGTLRNKTAQEEPREKQKEEGVKPISKIKELLSSLLNLLRGLWTR